MDYFYKILKNDPPIKGDTRKAVDLLIDIFKRYDGKPTKVDDHQAKMEKVPKAKEESNIEEN